MLEELHRRNYAASTIAYYIQHVEQFARFFKRSPDRLTPTHLRTYQAHLLRERNHVRTPASFNVGGRRQHGVTQWTTQGWTHSFVKRARTRTGARSRLRAHVRLRSRQGGRGVLP